ncbi:MAG: nuclear transport factor 2 family protein [Candidatus Methanofastidiosia archaeon]
MVENSPKSRIIQRVGAPEIDAVTLKIVALEFVEAINSGDPERLIALQTEDFAFIDMSGDIEHGQQGWSDYFSAHPEYRIHVQQVLIGGKGVAIIGRTSGSHVPPDVEAEETVLWTAEIRNGLVSEWRIYTDIEEAKKKALEED